MNQAKRDPNPESTVDPSYLEEIRAFREEQERIRKVLSAIGKERGRVAEPIANALFILGLLALLGARFLGHWVDNILSLELGLLLVSLKIIWMMRLQTRYYHFLFWVIHSIEFRQTELMQRMDQHDRLFKGFCEQQGYSSSAACVDPTGS